jgi:ABC-type antimicrobial peptide transport system permease subunit
VPPYIGCYGQADDRDVQSAFRNPHSAMTLRTLIRRSLAFHARSHVGTVLGAAVAATVLIGALVVGDSVRGSLRERALRRLGWVEAAVPPSDRFFTQGLAHRMESVLREDADRARIAPVLALPALVGRQDGAARANRVNLLGVPANFWPTNVSPHVGDIPTNSIVLNEALANQLNARVGDELIIRIRKPGALSPEVVLTPREGASAVQRLRVHAIASAAELGDFSLQPSQLPPLNAYVPIDAMARAVALPGKANMLLIGHLHGTHRPGPSTSREAAEIAMTTARAQMELGDAELYLEVLPGQAVIELRSPRVFLDPAINGRTATQLQALLGARPQAITNAIPILTYLATQFRAGTNSTPYSMITAAGPPYTPADLRDDELIVNDWLADDLRVRPGDTIELSYFDPDSAARLVERTNTFRVHSIVPRQGVHADRTLMPEFPGLAKAESTHDWDAGFPLVHKIREQDEDYWKQLRGTPKAFVSLAAGQKMWSNRFGNLTAIRYPVPGGIPVTEYQARLVRGIKRLLFEGQLGPRFEPVREQALAAVTQSQDFGQLFLGFSFFLIAAALLLMALLFRFSIEQRVTEIGTLLALGFTPKQVRRLFWLESGALAIVGSLVGLAGGVAYARAMLHGLSTIWRDAVGTSALGFHAELATLGVGFAASVIVAWLALGWSLRRQARRTARELLAGETASGNAECGMRNAESRTASIRRLLQTQRLSIGSLAGGLALAGAVALVTTTLARGDTASAGAFFGAGALLLASGLAFAAAWLRRLERSESGAHLTLASLGVRNVSRRRGRSLATVALLACGSFLIVSIGVFRLDSVRGAEKPSSGMGGFALIGESTLPVVPDLNTERGRDFFALDAQALAGVGFVPFRVRDGDDASCLNLNRAQKPRLLGVDPALLAGRFTFAKLATGATGLTNPWTALRTNSAFRIPHSALEVPAIGDAASIQWAMGKQVGDTLDYADEQGRAFKVRLVGAVANSILQGNLLIDEAAFTRLFPSEAGRRLFLIDAPPERVAAVAETLSRALRDVGLELTPTARRLAQFSAVQNTYLGTFQVLGGLGLLLGSAGLGVVVLRNVLERRAELALLLAVGFRAKAVRGLVLEEHAALLGLGLGLGLIAAAVAVLPALLAPGSGLPWGSLGVTVGAVFVSGLVWTWLATRVALRGELLNALRNE